MKKISLLLALLFFVSCSNDMTDKERIRQLATNNFVDEFSPISGLLQYYVRAYYAMPADKKEFLSFVEKYKDADPFFSEIEELIGLDILDTLTKETILFASYDDSIFFYLPNFKVGSSIIGTPFYWIEHPELYPPYKFTYYDEFRPSAYRLNGDYLFETEYNYASLNAAIDSVVSSHYNGIVTYNGYFFDGLSETPHRQQTPYLSIASFSPSTGSLEILSSLLPTDSLQVFSKSQKAYSPIEIPLEELCKDYLDELVTVLNENVKENTEVAKILMGIRWRCNYLE